MKSKSTIALSTTGVWVLLFLAACNRGETIKPERKAITEAVYASGFLVPEDEYKVYALADGYVTLKAKEAGDPVRKGEVLYQIQNDAAQARLGASSSALELARLNASENSPLLADLDGRVKSAAAKYKNDSLNHARYKNMLEQGAVTKAQYDQAALAFEVAGNELRSARENYRKTKEQVMVELKNAQSGVATSGLDNSNFVIRSLMDGMVYDTYKELGEAVRRNDLVAVIGHSTNKLLELSVDQQDIDKVKPGQEVVVKMDVTGSKVYKATVTKIYPNMNQSDQSFKVEARFSQDYGLAFVHTSVEANIVIAQKQNALVIPKTVIQGNSEVTLAGNGSGKVVKIEKGIENLGYVEVLSGISETDELVVPKQK